MSVEDWQLSSEQRNDTISRIKQTMATMKFFSDNADGKIDFDFDVIAGAIEKKAYTVARVEARTTTGMRPHHETLKVKKNEFLKQLLMNIP